MKHILTLPRSTATSNPPPSIQYSIILFSFVFLIPAAHSKTIRDIDQDLRHKHIVDQFKTKVLQHMGLSTPPQGYNASRDSLHGKLIREFFRKKRLAEKAEKVDFGDRDDVNDVSDVGNLQTVIFTSTDPDVWVPLQPSNTPSPTSSGITVFKFSTSFQQPDLPYHYLVIRSAILRMSISRQKRKLRPKHNNTVRVSLFLLSQSKEMPGKDATPNLIYSSIINSDNVKTLEININLQLLSRIIESKDKPVKIGIKIEDDENIHGQHSKQKTKASASQEQFKISKMKLEISTVEKDLRKARTKRQTHERCPENMCCRHSIYIDFEDIGWSDWVLSPTGYTAYFCKGGCSDTYKIASSFTGIKSLLHERMPDIVPAPVCAPTDYNSLDMIIFDGELKDVSYPGMVVTGCRCY